MKQVSSDNVQYLISAVANATNSFVEDARRVVDRLQKLQSSGGQLEESALGDLCRSVRNASAEIHKLKFSFDWQLPPSPEWFDHYIDLHYQFHNNKNSFWLERGVYSVLALKPEAEVLELCCGDGFNTYHFYSGVARRIVAVDFDPQAIAHATTYNSANNIEFRLANILTEMPEGRFANIIWDAAIEHFTEDEISLLMANIKQRLSPGGVLSGYTLIERTDGAKHLHQHEREFRSKKDLADFFVPHFKNVRVFETIHPARHNLYFYASDGVLPFDELWPHGICISR